MSDRFGECLAFVLKYEGGYVNDPDDRGGATNKGVTQRTYDAWRKGEGKSAQSVKDIADEEVRALYETRYWQECACNVVPQPGDALVFDSAVNCGPGNALTWLKLAGHDWHFYCALREAHYRALAQKPTQAKFLKGWLNRLTALRKFAGIA